MNLLTKLIWLILSAVLAIYPDQYGQNDWHIENLGKIDQASFNSRNKVGSILTTISNSRKSLASLDIRKNGQILWRKKFTENILYFEYIFGQSLPATSDTILVITEDKFLLIKSESGTIFQEAQKVNLHNCQFHSKFQDKTKLLFICDNNSFIIISNTQATKNSLVKIQVEENFENSKNEDYIDYFFIHDGQIFRNSDSLGQVKNQCNSQILNNQLIESCDGEGETSKRTLVLADFEPEIIPEISSQINLIPASNTEFIFGHDNNQVYKISNAGAQAKSISIAGKIEKIFLAEHLYVFYRPKRSSNEKLFLATYDPVTFSEIDLTGLIFNSAWDFHEIPQFIAVNEFTHKNAKQARMLTQNNLNLAVNFNDRWTREEGLASISNAILVNLPEDAAEEAGPENAQHQSGFFNRITSDFLDAYTFLYAKIEITFLYLYNMAPYNNWSKFPEDFANAGYDTSKIRSSAYGVRKLIVTHTTGSNTIFVLDSKTGDIFKKLKISNLNLADQVVLINDPTSTQVTVVGHSNQDLVKLVQFEATAADGTNFVDLTKNFPSGIKIQSILADVILFENGQNFQINQETGSLHFTEMHENSIVGKLMNLDSKNSVEIWEYNLEEGHELVSFKSSSGHQANAVGRALQDRSIQYKYLNPHILALITKWTSADLAPMLTLQVLDGITGNILYTHSQPNAVQPVQLALIDNWVSFTYWDNKKRRHSIESVEFYKGKASNFEQMNNFNHEFYSSSASYLGAQDLTVLKQGYILPFEPSSLETTFTKKGITQRSLLVPVADKGQLVLISHSQLDARRAPKAFKRDEKGILQVDTSNMDDSKEIRGAYYPEIRLTPDSLVSNNRTIQGLNAVAIADSKLESTFVAFAYGGLDLYFVNDLAPSRKYDRLDGFDSMKIALLGSLIGLLLLTVFLKNRHEWELIKKSWK